MSKPLTPEERKEYGTIQSRDWHKKYDFIFLSDLYPDDIMPTTFLLLTKEEIAELNAKTKRRIIHFNKKVNPKGYAGFSEYK